MMTIALGKKSRETCLRGKNMFEGWVCTGILINVVLSFWILDTLKQILKELKRK